MNDKTHDARQKILQSAVITFARKGYAGTSVQDILRAVKLSKPTLYYYFENKAGLFHAILQFAFDESSRLAKAAADGEQTAEGKLVAVATALFGFAENNKDLMRLVFSAVFAAPEEIPSGCACPTQRRCHHDFILQIVRAAQKSGEIDARYDAHDLTHGFFGAVSHHVRTHLLMPEGKLDRRRAQKLVAIFLNGARKKK
jgi:AcrR family transcriptional regulator